MPVQIPSQPVARLSETADHLAHAVLWSDQMPWGSSRYVSVGEAVHDVSSTPSARSQRPGAREQVRYSSLTRKMPDELVEMRRLLSRWGLRVYTEKLEKLCGCRTIEGLLNIKRDSLEKVGMPRPEVRTFERGAAELARQYITIYHRQKFGSGGAEAATVAAQESANTAAAWEAAAVEAATAAADTFDETLREVEDRQRYISEMQRLGRLSRVDASRMKQECQQRLNRVRASEGLPIVAY